MFRGLWSLVTADPTCRGGPDPVIVAPRAVATELGTATLLQATTANCGTFGEREACALGVLAALALEDAFRLIMKARLYVDAVRPLSRVLFDKWRSSCDAQGATKSKR